jgi:MFS superfamily sulfate permease-like transporter
LLSGLKINRKTIGRDTLAGLTAAIAAIPDGMAWRFWPESIRSLACTI